MNAPSPNAARPLLEVRGLRTVFHSLAGAYAAVDGVDLSIAPGEVVGLAEIGAELRRVGRVVDAGEELDLRGQPLDRLGHARERVVDLGARHVAARLLGARGDPPVHGVAVGGDVEDGDPVRRVARADPREHLLVPLAVAQRAVDPHVLARAQRRLLRELDEVPRLAPRVEAGGERVARHVARPLGQRRLEEVGVDRHHQRQHAALAQPVHHVRLAGAHRAGGEDDPRRRPRLCRW